MDQSQREGGFASVSKSLMGNSFKIVVVASMIQISIPRSTKAKVSPCSLSIQAKSFAYFMRL